MKRWIAVVALAALAFVPGARATDVTEGTTTPNVGGPPGYVWDGSRWRRQTGTTEGRQSVLHQPAIWGPVSKVYFDTLSIVRLTDSLITPIDVRNLEAITFGCKIEGVGVSGEYRLGFAVRWHSALVSDSNATWTNPALFKNSAIADSGTALINIAGSVTPGTATAASTPATVDRVHLIIV